MARPRARPQTTRLALAALVALATAPLGARAACWDADADQTPDVYDNCPTVANDDQADTDQDGAGDACDCDGVDPAFHPGAPDLVPDGADQDCDQVPDDGADTDGDLIEDTFDNCPFLANPDQVDQDLDGQGDACKFLSVVEVWPPPYCEGVPSGLPLRARFNRPLDASAVANTPGAQVRGELQGVLDTQTLLDDDLAGLTVTFNDTPPAGERVHALLGTGFGLPFGYQWRHTTAVRPSDAVFETLNLDGLGAFGIGAGDLDGDGAPDLVLCGFPAPELRVLFNRGAGAFVLAQVGPPYGACGAVKLADLEPDGDLDVVLQDTNGKVRVLRNDGFGGLTADAGPVLNDGGVFDLGDFDADGRVDLLGPRTSLDNAGRVLRNVAGSFAAATGGMGGFVSNAARLLDFEPDGDLDLLFQNGSDPRGLTAGRNLGLVGVQNLGRITGNELGAGGTFIDAADLDGDGHPEIAVSSYGQTSQLFRFALDGTLNVGPPLPQTNGRRMQWADLEGDGDPDLWYESVNDDVRVLVNEPGGLVDSGLSLAPHEFPPSPNFQVFGFTVLDLDGDGDLDVVVDGSNPRVILQRPDFCPNDPAKIDPGACDCGTPDLDTDADQIVDCDDLCPFDPTPVLGDLDADGLGDPCDPDDDEDGVPDFDDTDPVDPTRCADTDADGCDDCARNVTGFAPGPDADPANDGVDREHDGVCEVTDNCRFAANPDQADEDQDGVGDACDPCLGNPVNTPGCGSLPDVEFAVDAQSPADAAGEHRLDLRVAADAGGQLDAAGVDDAAPHPDALRVQDALIVLPTDFGAVLADANVMPAPDLGRVADAAPPPGPDARSDAAAPPGPDARPDAAAATPDARPDDSTPPGPDARPDAAPPPQGDGPGSPPPEDDARPVADARLEDAASTPEVPALPTDGLRGLAPKGGGGCATLPVGTAPRAPALLFAVFGVVGLARARRRPSARRDDLPPHV